MYSIFSEFYDTFTKDIDYSKFADIYEKLFKKMSAKPEELLDLGCGTGSLTIELARRGYDMTGVDISPQMLDVASNKAKAKGVDDILFINQDITQLDLYGTVDGVVSSLDVINHLTDKRQVQRCFNMVSLFLIPKGIFIFDLNTPYKFLNEYANNTYVFESGQSTCIWQNEFDKRSKICDFYLTFYKKQGELYKKSEDYSCERMYSIDEITEMLEKSGMKIKGVYNESLKKLSGKDSRAIIAAIKEN